MQRNAFLRTTFALLAVGSLGIAVGRSDTSAAPAPAASPTVVSIKNFAFDPATLTVPVGTTVEWINKDSVSHTATSTGKAPASFDSGNLDQNQKWSFTFKKAGTYAYVCTYHPNMVAKVIVQ